MAQQPETSTPLQDTAQEITHVRVLNPEKNPDGIVVGLGIHGAAALREMRAQGMNVVGIDRFSPPDEEDRTSSGHRSRITRTAIGEDPNLAKAALQSIDHMRELEALTGQEIFVNCGCLVIGKPDGTAVHGVSDFFRNMKKAAVAHNIHYEELGSHELRFRYPQLNVREEDIAILDKMGGFFRIDHCIEASLKLAQANGANLQLNTQMTGFQSAKESVTVRTTAGDYSTGALVLCVGPWAHSFLPKLVTSELQISRQPIFYWEIHGDPQRFAAERFPTIIYDFSGEGPGQPLSNIYGFPLEGGLVIDGKPALKFAHEDRSLPVSPDHASRNVTEEEASYTHDNYIKSPLLQVGPLALKGQACWYSNYPGARFFW